MTEKQKVYIVSRQVDTAPNSGQYIDCVKSSLNAAKEFVTRSRGREFDWVEHNAHGLHWTGYDVNGDFYIEEFEVD